jgi:outer membrane protein insertion porin family
MKNSFFALMLFLLSSPIIGQAPNSPVSEYLDYARARDFTIMDIKITGVKYLQTSYLVNISGLAVGQNITIPGEKITQAIEKFWTYTLKLGSPNSHDL